MARSREELLTALGDLDADERTELAAALAENADAQADVADADTERERREAAERAAEAEAELATAFESAGLSAEQGRALMLVVDRASSANTEAAVRRVMDEYAIEVDDDAGDDGGAGDAPKPRRKKKKATALADLRDDPDADPAPDPPPDREPENPPATTHWFHRPLIRGEKEA